MLGNFECDTNFDAKGRPYIYELEAESDYFGFVYKFNDIS